jgi:hypothetical protein
MKRQVKYLNNFTENILAFVTKSTKYDFRFPLKSELFLAAISDSSREVIGKILLNCSHT